MNLTGEALQLAMKECAAKVVKGWPATTEEQKFRIAQIFRGVDAAQATTAKNTRADAFRR